MSRLRVAFVSFHTSPGDPPGVAYAAPPLAYAAPAPADYAWMPAGYGWVGGRYAWHAGAWVRAELGRDGRIDRWR